MVIAFDLNGTLLDTGAIAPELRNIFGNKVTADHFMAEVLKHSMATTLAQDYRPFSDMAANVLEMIATGHGIVLSAAQIEHVRAALLRLPPFPDVIQGLRRLRSAGLRLAVLTNSGGTNLEHQLEHSGLRMYFDQVLSVESVGKYKPALDVYRFAADALAVSPSGILMVAAHHWDLIGAARAGFGTAFVKRPKRALLPQATPPDHVVKDLNQLADVLLEKRAIRTRSVGSRTGVLGVALGIAAAALIPTAFFAKRGNQAA